MLESSHHFHCHNSNPEAPRIKTRIKPFTNRDGYPRRLPDKGTYWHMGKEVKKRAKRMRWYDHPELTPPKPKPRPTKGDIQAAKDREAARIKDLRHRDRWGVDERGFRTVKAKKTKRKRKTPAP